MTDTTCPKTFILASASPRRKTLLERAGYKFDVVCSNIDESAFDTEGADSVEHTKQLALAKANDVARKYPDRLVLAADTIVDFNGKIIGKPEDAAHAEQITRLLFSAPHKVITGIALINISRSLQIVEADTTIVYPKALTEQQIAEHIKKEDWKGKAGAYGIQETADEFVEKIKGSFTNVIGLPMELSQRLLAALGIGPQNT